MDASHPQLHSELIFEQDIAVSIELSKSVEVFVLAYHGKLPIYGPHASIVLSIATAAIICFTIRSIL